MCLDSVVKELDEPKKMVFYKLFRKRDNKLYALTCRIGKRRTLINTSTSHRASKGTLCVSTHPYHIGNTPSYKSGFHGYETFMAAKRARKFDWVKSWLVQFPFGGGIGVPVYTLIIAKCEGLVHTIGKQNDITVLVASTMKILKVY